MIKIRLVAICAMGLEDVLKREIEELGYGDIFVSAGKVEFGEDLEDICIANIRLRTADRILIKLKEFKADTFDMLFEGVKAYDFSWLIPPDGEFPVVKANTYRSKLLSKPDIQAISKKAMVESLKMNHSVEILPETGSRYSIRVDIIHNKAVIFADTTGDGLFKRGYREDKGEAPIKETLAAAMVMLSEWDGKTALYDPMCGSGTILIEAAMIARNIAPGGARRFESEKWKCIPESAWIKERDRAYMEERDECPQLFGSDIDEEVIKTAKKCAEIAGVADNISFKVKDVKKALPLAETGMIISNPPYGDRLISGGKIKEFYKELGYVTARRFQKWKVNFISSHMEFEDDYGKKADKKELLYNGGIECYLYRYFK